MRSEYLWFDWTRVRSPTRWPPLCPSASLDTFSSSRARSHCARHSYLEFPFISHDGILELTRGVGVHHSPVQQLARMPAGDSSNKKATKKRIEFADAFDELSSHLHTTFTALSTAFARNTARYPVPQPESNHDAPLSDLTSTAHLMIALGPTAGTVKARVILTIDGLEVKIWGTREAVQPSAPPEEVGEESFEEDDDEQVEDEDSTDESESEESVSEESDSEEEEQDEDSEDEAQDDSEEEQISDKDEDDLAELPPDSPPPSEPHNSRVPSPLCDATNTSRVAPQHPPPLRASPPAYTVPPSIQNSASSTPMPSKPHLAPPQTKSYAEQQQIWRSATNLMSRQLVNACAEGDGMACEMGECPFRRLPPSGLSDLRKLNLDGGSADANAHPPPRAAALLASRVAAPPKPDFLPRQSTRGLPTRVWHGPCQRRRSHQTEEDGNQDGRRAGGVHRPRPRRACVRCARGARDRGRRDDLVGVEWAPDWLFGVVRREMAIEIVEGSVMDFRFW